MKKFLINILLLISFILIPSLSFATMDNVRINTIENTGRNNNNNELEEIAGTNFFYVGTNGEKGIKYFLLNIARDLRVIVFAFVLLIGLIMVIKLIFAENTEEEQKHLKLGILWASIGIIVMQVAFPIYKVLFDKDVGAVLARDFGKRIIEPFIDMLMLGASFVFITMGILAFYRIVTAGGNDEGMKKGKNSIIYSIIGFIVIQFAEIVVKNTYNPNCGGGGFLSIWGTSVCENIKSNTQIITVLINWLNTFVSIFIVIMLIYAGFLVMTGGGEEDKNKKAKNIMLYVGIGVLVLFASYVIMTFFILPESKI